ncbi:MAG: PTS sugar transporter subunit IIA [Syntrophotaleaceae bacterium]
MNLSVKDAARILSVSEKTIYRWIKQEIIPAYKVHETYRFTRAELLEWATSRRMGISPEALADPEGDSTPLPTLTEAMEAGGVFYRIEGQTREDVLTDVVAHLRLPEEVDREYLRRVLIAREKLASTGIGEGIAIPHPRNPVLLHVTRPTVTLCFLERPVDFRSLDGRPVQTLFTLISPTVRSHLHMLSRLGYLLKDQSFRQALDTQESRETLFSSLRKAEERLAR